jgi:hypothetical protein
MRDEYEQLVEQLVTTPPSCLHGFASKRTEPPKPWDDNPRSDWLLACPCGSDQGRLHGYPLSSLVDIGDDDDIFVSPLTFKCVDCSNVIPLLDTKEHGYHAEAAKLEGEVDSVKIRGSGPPNKLACPNCSSNVFKMIAGFVYWDVEEIAEEIEIGKVPDFFDIFLLYTQCVACSEQSEPTAFGKL